MDWDKDGKPIETPAPVGDTIPADGQGDTSQDTSALADDTKVDTPDAAADLSAVFKELELGDTYGSPDAALRAMPEKERTITRLQQENADFRRILQQLTVPKEPVTEQPLTTEEFHERFQADPPGTLRQSGFATEKQLAEVRQDLGRLTQIERANNFAQMVSGLEGLEDVGAYVRSHMGSATSPNDFFPGRGVNPLWDKIMDAYAADPGLQSATPASVVRLLHATLKSKKITPDNPPVSPQRKQGAQTNRGDSPNKTAPLGAVPNYMEPQWTPEKIKEDMQRRGLWEQ